MKVGWNESLSKEIKRKWKLFYQQQEKIGLLLISRKSIPSDSDKIELHGFCDAF